jgi:hypothetical protein
MAGDLSVLASQVTRTAATGKCYATVPQPPAQGRYMGA